MCNEMLFCEKRIYRGYRCSYLDIKIILHWNAKWNMGSNCNCWIAIIILPDCIKWTIHFHNLFPITGHLATQYSVWLNASLLNRFYFIQYERIIWTNTANGLPNQLHCVSTYSESLKFKGMRIQNIYRKFYTKGSLYYVVPHMYIIYIVTRFSWILDIVRNCKLLNNRNELIITYLS